MCSSAGAPAGGTQELLLKSFGRDPSTRNLLDKASAAQNLDGNRLTGSLPRPRVKLRRLTYFRKRPEPNHAPPQLSRADLAKLDGTHADFPCFVAAMRDIDQRKGQFRVQAQNSLA